MRTTKIFRVFVASGVAVLMMGQLKAQEGTVSLKLSDELERAIYLHEGEASLDEAEQAFRGILEESSLVDSLAAEASYRLASVYLDQGKRALAMTLLSDLVKKYPNEELWVSEAAALLPQEFVPELTPWEDGERTHYDWSLPTGDVIGHSVSTIYGFESEGRELWRKETRFLLNGHRATVVEFDKESFDTVYGGMVLGQMGTTRARYAENGLSVNVDYSKSGANRNYDFNQRVYDNEQTADLLRQIPIELGYRMSKKIFVSFSGMPLDITFEVKSIEEMDTALGRIMCYSVEIDMVVQKQTIVLTADERRIPVVFLAGAIEGRLTKVETVDVKGTTTYRNDVHGFSLELPALWSPIKQRDKSDKSDQVVWLAEPMVRGVYMVASELNSDWKREDPISVEGLLEEVARIVRRQFKDIEQDATFVKEIQVGELEGSSYLFKAAEGAERQGDVYIHILLGAEKHYFFQGVVSKEDQDEMLPVFEDILMSLKTDS